MAQTDVIEMERYEDGGPIRLSFQSQGHPPVPSVRAIRLGDIPLGLPSGGHRSNQVNQMEVITFPRRIQLTSTD